MGLKPLDYREWGGKRRGSLLRFWPIARAALGLIFRRKISWAFLILSLLNFLFTSSVIYALAQVKETLGQSLPPFFSLWAQKGSEYAFTGAGAGYMIFIYTQGTVVMMMLVLAGGILVGNDFRGGAVAFYLSKPISKLEYFLGKFAAAFALTATITLLPALVLFIEYGAFSESFDYYTEHLHVLGAILASGAIVCAVPSLLILGISSILKRMIPIVLAWGCLFVFLPTVARFLREIREHRGGTDPWAWGLLDLWWTDLRWISNALFGVKEDSYGERWPWAALALACVSLLSCVAFWRKISAVEVVK